jgi:hypothetical protein
MTYTTDSKDPSERALFSLDIVDDLAQDEVITGVATAITVHQGQDRNAAAMLSGPANFSGTVVSQLIRAGLDGNWYRVRFLVYTNLQTLAYTLLIPVVDEFGGDSSGPPALNFSIPSNSFYAAVF